MQHSGLQAALNRGRAGEAIANLQVEHLFRGNIALQQLVGDAKRADDWPRRLA